MLAMNWGLMAEGMWRDDRGCNIIDGGAHFYDTYETADGRYIALGPVEPQFYAELLGKLGLGDDPDLSAQRDPKTWDGGRAKLAALLKTRPRSHWEEVFEGSDACVSPVLSMTEATVYPHNVARETYREIGGRMQPMPAPRFSATPADTPGAGAGDPSALLDELGYSRAEIAALRASGAIA
jgi:alpha-methylacyl-CoA racemase